MTKSTGVLVCLCVAVSSCGTATEATVADWVLGSGTDVMDPAETHIELLVVDPECEEGWVSPERIRPPEVEYEPDRVTITIRIEPSRSSERCRTTPHPVFAFELNQPLATRKLVQGGRTPTPTLRDAS